MNYLFHKLKKVAKGLKTWTKLGVFTLTSIYFYSYYEEIFYSYFPKNKQLKIAKSEIASRFDFIFTNAEEYVKINSNSNKSENLMKNAYLVCEVFPKTQMDLEQIFKLAKKFKLPVITTQEEYYILNKNYYIKLNLQNFNELKINAKNLMISLNPGIKIKDLANRLSLFNLQIKGLEKDFVNNLDEDYTLNDILHNAYYDDTFEKFNDCLNKNLISFKVMSPDNKVTCINNYSNNLLYSNINLNSNFFLKNHQILGVITDLVFKIEPVSCNNSKIITDKNDKINSSKLVFSNIINDVTKISFTNIKNFYNNKESYIKYLKESLGLDLELNSKLFSKLIFKSVKAKVNKDEDVIIIINKLNKYLNSLCKEEYTDLKDISTDKSNEKRFQGIKFIRNKKKYNFDSKNKHDFNEETNNKIYYIACYNTSNRSLEISFFKNSNLLYIDNSIKSLLKLDEICDDLKIGLNSEELTLLGNYEENMRRILGVNQIENNIVFKKTFDSDYLLNPHLSIKEPTLIAQKMRSNKLFNFVVEKYKIL
jgi:hypothetical protein